MADESAKVAKVRLDVSKLTIKMLIPIMISQRSVAIYVQFCAYLKRLWLYGWLMREGGRILPRCAYAI